MAFITVPNQLDGTVRASEQNENFEALYQGLSDGTKDVTVNTAAVAGSSAVSAVICDGACAVQGEANDEKTYIQLANGTNSYNLGSFYLTWDGYPGAVDAESNGVYMQRSGSLIGWGMQMIRTAPGLAQGFSMTIGKYTGASSSLVSLGDYTWPASPSELSYASTLTRNVYSFATGDVLYLSYNHTGGNAPNCALSVFAEVQWDS